APTDDTTAVFAANLDNFRAEFVDAIRAGQVGFGPEVSPDESYRRLLLSRGTATVPPAKAAEFRSRLAALVGEVLDAEYEEDGVPIRLLAIFYAPTD
ncbi:MAG TPA: hypothetical protein VEO01_37540, partial [Pseudonocardiaceae bacterium]|nr:hypothetical protein [Pseudonocardiaceae bacterium]